jgi:hypothetical protein
MTKKLSLNFIFKKKKKTWLIFFLFSLGVSTADESIKDSSRSTFDGSVATVYRKDFLGIFGARLDALSCVTRSVPLGLCFTRAESHKGSRVAGEGESRKKTPKRQKLQL